MSFNSLLSFYSHFSDFPQILARLYSLAMANVPVQRRRNAVRCNRLCAARSLETAPQDAGDERHRPQDL